MVNVSRLNPELTGLSVNLWAILVYLCIFLVWNIYENLNPKLVYALKMMGLAGLLILALLFKAGTADEVSWLQTSWWGILGLIGWGYFTASLIYIFVKDNLLLIGLFWMFFVALNILSQLQLLSFLNPLKPILGVVISGNTPSIVLAGMFFSVLIRTIGFSEYRKISGIGLLLGIGLIALGFVLRNWFIISKIQGTPSWAMICNGISITLFVLLYLIIDIAKRTKWTALFQPAGQNSLTTYLAPDILYYSIWMSGLPVLFYKQSESALIIIADSIVWALAMIGFAWLLARIGIRLKL